MKSREHNGKANANSGEQDFNAKHHVTLKKSNLALNNMLYEYSYCRTVTRSQCPKGNLGKDILFDTIPIPRECVA
jgi:hypothetical protein